MVGWPGPDRNTYVVCRLPVLQEMRQKRKRPYPTEIWMQMVTASYEPSVALHRTAVTAVSWAESYTSLGSCLSGSRVVDRTAVGFTQNTNVQRHSSMPSSISCALFHAMLHLSFHCSEQHIDTMKHRAPPPSHSSRSIKCAVPLSQLPLEFICYSSRIPHGHSRALS